MKAYANFITPIVLGVILFGSCSTKKQIAIQPIAIDGKHQAKLSHDTINKKDIRPYYPWLNYEVKPYEPSANYIALSSKDHYELALQEMKAMFEDKREPDFERAVFLSENPYHNGRFTYSEFQNSITELQLVIQQLVQANDYSDTIEFDRKVNQYGRFNLKDLEYLPEERKELYRTALCNWAIFKYLTDTVEIFTIKDSSLVGFYHAPYSYATSDPFGIKDWRHSQVMNLLISEENKGNCYALTVLFKILSDRFNANSRICTAPQHIYIQHQDPKGQYYNVEMATAGHPGDGIIQTLTYTPTEGIMSGIALRDYTTKQSIGLCIVNLAKSYERKFKAKDDEFLLRCAELALAHDSLNLNALLLKQQVLDSRVTKYAVKNGINSVQKLKQDTGISKTALKLEKHLALLYNLGYREMPLDMQELIMNPWGYDPTKWNRKSQNARPFASFEPKDPKDAEYWTLTKGMFKEIWEPTEKETYGHFTITTATGKLKTMDTISQKGILIDPVAFAYDFGARMYDARIGHFVSVDPLAKAYPSISPYAFVANNPISFTDLDGKIIWDPQAKKEVVFNEESKKFMYKDGTELSETYKKQAMPTLEKLAASKVGIEIIKAFMSASTKVIIDETHRQRKSSLAKGANSLVLPSENKNEDGLYEEAIITPIWANIEESSERDKMSVNEKLVATMSVEWGHIGTKAQIDLEASVGGPDVFLSDPVAFAKVYNGLLNDAVRKEIAYRQENNIAIDEGVFQPILRVQQSEIGSKVSFDSTNQKTYDDFKAGKK
ncbi:MAG: hypothetical protein MUC81_12180 [Bacteroidia bacterium]|jgi:RHS repeat-associated protein|nr:hypothetical protein [Bacteroidia bacterium]